MTRYYRVCIITGIMKKLITISLITAAFIMASPTSAFASGKYNSNSWKTQTEKNYGISDEGDNAHPSGKDRSVEKGYSYPQGNSQSDPDDNGKGPDRSNGGPDKPGGTGGVDKEDQDGNNGCGNDDDFEDDNEGWCGQKPKKEKPVDPCPEEPENPEEPEEPETPTTPEEPKTPKKPEVLGTTTLPNTGESLNLDFALGMVAFGILAWKASKLANKVQA